MVQFINMPPSPTGQVTAIILGCGRGGTSAVAGMLRELGLGVPEETHPLKHEASPVVYDGELVDVAATSEAIRALDRRHDAWSWKSPRDIFTVHSWASLVRNPAFVVVFRHPVDTAESVVKHESVTFEVAAAHVGEVNAELSRFVLSTPFPVAVVSYEELCARPSSVIPGLVEWLGTAVDYDRFRAACDFVGRTRWGYRAVTEERQPTIGFSPEEIANDRAAAQHEMFGRATTILRTATDSLAEDCLRAQEIVQHLEHGLGHPFRGDVPEGLRVVAGPVFEEQAEPASPHEAYEAARRRFTATAMWRVRLQQQLTELAALPDAPPNGR